MADESLCSDAMLNFSTNAPPRCSFVIEDDDEPILTPEQEEQTFDYREQIRRQDLRYLRTHPELRAITQMIIKLALTMRPAPPITVFFADFFSRPREEIEAELKPFLERQGVLQRKQIVVPDIAIDQIPEPLIGEEEEPEQKEIPPKEYDIEKTEVFRNLDRLRKNIRIALSKTTMKEKLEDVTSAKTVPTEMLTKSETSSTVSTIADERPTSTAGSTTSLVFSQSIEDFLISMQVKHRDQIKLDSPAEYGTRQSRKFHSFSTHPKRLHVAPGSDLTPRQDERGQKLKDLKVDPDSRPKRSLVTKHKSGLYTVLEVDETQESN